jgi:hypothetical protein
MSGRDLIAAPCDRARASSRCADSSLSACRDTGTLRRFPFFQSFPRETAAPETSSGGSFRRHVIEPLDHTTVQGVFGANNDESLIMDQLLEHL